MSGDGVAEIVGAHMALSGPTAEVWRRVAHGDISADEGAALLLAGNEVGEEEREEIERGKLVFGPRPERREQEEIERLLAGREARAAVVKPRSGASAGWIAGVVALAAAAILIVWMVAGETPSGNNDTEMIALSAGYKVELEKMVAGSRGAEVEDGSKPGDVPRFAIDGKMLVRLVPEEDVVGEVEVVVFARGAAGARRLGIEPKVYPSGVVEWKGAVRELGLGVGEWELVLVVGLGGKMPQEWDGVEQFKAATVKLSIVDIE